MSDEVPVIQYEVELLCETDDLDGLIRWLMITNPGTGIVKVEGLSDEELRARIDVVFQSMSS